MSYASDEYYEVYQEVVRKARKSHKCDACRLPIRPGDYYCVVTWVLDSRADGVKRCGACQRTHEHLRGLCRSDPLNADMWPDESLNCGLDYAEEWGDDPPDEIADLPFISADERGSLLKVVGHVKRLSHDEAVGLKSGEEAVGQ